MTPFLQLTFVIAVILLLAKLMGYLATRIGQPSVLGELLAGLILGPSLVNLTQFSFITDPHLEEIILELGELGVLLLMFLAGLELHLSDLARNTRVSALSGILGVVFPLSMGFGVGLLTGMDTSHSVFLGLTLGATSVSISAQTLMELGRLRTRVGLGLLGAAVFDDVLVILLLSTFLALAGGGGGGWLAILGVVLKMAGFLLVAAAFGLWGIPPLMRRFSKLSISQGSLTLAIVIMIVFALLAEILGNMAAITGTFLAGLFFSRTPEKAEFEKGLHALAYSFFVPIFFVSIGLTINLKEINLSTIWLMLLIILIAVIGKMFGAGLGARLSGFPWDEAIQLGAGMVSRGEVGLIVAKVGMDQGLIDTEVFSIIVAMVLVTTLITPPLLRGLFQRALPVKNANVAE